MKILKRPGTSVSHGRRKKGYYKLPIIVFADVRKVTTNTSAENLAAGEAIDERKVLMKTVEKLLATEVGLSIVVYSKDFFSTIVHFPISF